ncbi:hypothetical protein IC582_002166 [Cucumis melo]
MPFFSLVRRHQQVIAYDLPLDRQLGNKEFAENNLKRPFQSCRISLIENETLLKLRRCRSRRVHIRIGVRNLLS